MVELQHRRSVRLKGYDYTQAGAYFVTVCAWNHEPLFGEIVGGEMRLNGLGEVVRACWTAIPDHFTNVELADCVVMPNHIHGIIVMNTVGLTHLLPQRAGPPPNSLGAIIGSFKSAASKRIAILQCAHGGAVWQRNYYEHVIRDEADYNRIAEYVEHNPQRWAEDSLHPDAVQREDRQSGKVER